MPRGDRTGPMGMGPLTGRGAGYCAGFAAPGFTNPGGGRGFGMGGGGRGGGFGNRGGGRGWRNMFHATGLPGWLRFGQAPTPFGYAPAAGGAVSGPQPNQALELQALRNQAAALQTELAAVQQRLQEIEDQRNAE